MPKLKNRKYWLIPVTILFVVVFAFIIIRIYSNTLEDIKKNHQLQQMEMAKNAGQGIIYFVNHLASDLLLLSSYPGIKSSGSFHLKPFLKNYKSHMVHSIFVSNKKAEIISFTGELLPQFSPSYTEETISLIKNKNKREFLISSVGQSETKVIDKKLLFFQLMVPIISESADTTGYLGYIINFNALIDQFIKPLKLTKNDFAWIIDGTGRLIYHPLHHEMLFRSITVTSDECFSCHNSFTVQQSIIASMNPSVVEYSVVGNEPDKIMAYFPIQIQDQKWILVLSTFTTKVTESLREKFQTFFIIGFIILGLLISFSILVYYINSKRIRAEEANRNLEQMNTYQEQLNQASKMASIGELVDSVAHEINTPTGIIAAHIDGLILNEEINENIGSKLKIIKRQTRRISEFTKSLLNYSQRMSFNPEMIDLKILVNECLYLLGHRFRSKKIKVLKDFENDLPKIQADLRQMEQVFINLLNNAVDAIENYGEIIISLKFLDNKTDKNSFVIKIEDNGTGISEENLAKIFNPFFSTKQKSNGTGLGLSIVKAIISRHKGSILVQSKPGERTIFEINLPEQIWENK